LFRFMGAELTAITHRGYWRVKIVWPRADWARAAPRYFGKFQSKAEAERWIAEHPLLTKQRDEPDKKTAPTCP
jgi:hypothetical protein